MRRVSFLVIAIFALVLSGCSIADKLKNHTPIANAGADQTVAKSDSVLFDGSGSNDPDGKIVSFAWDFKDGSEPSTGPGALATHVYTTAGEYNVTLTVTDDKGETDEDTCTVTVYDPDMDDDDDGLTNGEEIKTYKSDPNKKDTDGDGLNDGAEIDKGTDPTTTDTDGDGLTDDIDVVDTVMPARQAEPVVLTGVQLPTWSRLAAVGFSLPWPAGTGTDKYTSGYDYGYLVWTHVRNAHNGYLQVPPDVRTGVPVDQICAFRYDGSTWKEIPVQVDERFPYFLANANSDFSIYSAVDYELTYAWDVERWQARPEDELIANYSGAMADPAEGLDDDDEIVFMASDAGIQAPSDKWPSGITSSRQEIAIVDPLNPADVKYVYLFLREGGCSIKANSNEAHVRYTRDPDANQFIARHTFKDDDPEKLGSSNTGYGSNLPGYAYDPCGQGTNTTEHPRITFEGKPYSYSTDRFPRDGVTITTDAYKWYASGRWMVRDMRIAKPEKKGFYGEDLIDRWKGRAFQQTPDSSVSLIGFEDEQVNWEGNCCLIGERIGPVRAIRETWGADSGTNVTKTEAFYRDAVTYHFHLRVHPIPPDGLYTSWDYNANVAAKYYNVFNPAGVNIDGEPDELLNTLTEINEIGGQPMFFDFSDPTFDLPLSFLRWEQVSGHNDYGSLVYIFELKGPSTLVNGAIIPYYRDDSMFDDGTGDDPIARPWPGEAQSDPRLKSYSEETDPMKKQGSWGSHGVHLLFPPESDNMFTPFPITEVDAQQWQFAVPTHQPVALGEPYAQVVRVPLKTVAVEQTKQ